MADYHFSYERPTPGHYDWSHVLFHAHRPIRTAEPGGRKSYPAHGMVSLMALDRSHSDSVRLTQNGAELRGEDTGHDYSKLGYLAT